MAFVMIAGPQILSAIFLATSESWRRNSAAYVAGAALSITLMDCLGSTYATSKVSAGCRHCGLRPTQRWWPQSGGVLRSREGRTSLPRRMGWESA
jgi:hypothetical protein